jgi:ABC-type multidrug transport system fused ATPase/permease subunit
MKSGQSFTNDSDDHHKASFFDLFKHSKRIDIILMIVGGFGALVMGGIQPIFFYLIGSIYNEVDPESGREDYYESATNIAKYLIIFAAVFMVASYIAVTSWIFVGSRQGYYYRRELFNSIIRQDPEWYDENNVAELPGGLMSDSLKIERATGDKLILLIAMIAMILASFIMAIIVATQITLICLALGPLTLLGVYVMSTAMEESARKTNTSYKKAGGITEEVLNEIKTVTAHKGVRVLGC